MKKILTSLLIAPIFLLCFANVTHAAPPAGFQTTQIIGSGLTNPTAFEFAPDGRIFILEQTGKVQIYKNGALLPTPFTTIPVSQAGGDLGLLGIVFDPQYYSNHYVYFYYTSNTSRSTIARYDASGDTAVAGPFIVYESPDVTQTYHAGGTIRFGSDGKLYFAIGDNGYSANAQNLSNTFGKVHRINKDGTIPADNPYVGQAGKLPEIWAYGLRNPFRFQFDSATDRLYIGDVGEQTWEEIDKVAKGANMGWPTCEGVCNVAGTTNPIHAYNHNGSSSSVTGGLVYHGSLFPSSYEGRYFFGDYARGFINTLTLDSNGDSTGVQTFDSSAGSIVDLKTASDGSMYYLNIFPGRLYRVSYTTSNNVPVAKSSVDITSGQNPLTVHFSSAGSLDPDGTPITYSWDFGDGTSSTQANPTKIYNAKGNFTIILTVSDGVYQAQATPLVVQVGTPPSLTISSPVSNSNYKAGDTISYSSTGQDSVGATLPDSAFTTEVLFHHSTHIHPFLGPLVGSRTGQFTIPTTGESSADTYYEVRITATDSDGLTTVKSVNILPIKVNITFTTSPANQKIILDSQTLSTPVTIQSVVGFKREVNVPSMQTIGGNYYQFDTWSDGGTQRHFYTTPVSDSSLTANLKQTPPFVANYFNNTTLTGSPVLTRNEGPIDYNWGNGSPDPAVNSDNFSARWTKMYTFETGTYRFDTLSDDGVRLYVDNNLVINGWQDQASTPYTGNIALTQGDHEIKFEYYEKGGGALVRLTWDQISSTPPSGTPTPTPTPVNQTIISFTLINANTDQPIAGFDPIPEGGTLNLSSLPTTNLNIRANTSPSPVGSVRFGYDANANYGTETNVPYALGSDNNGDYFSWTPTVGAHSVTATPYTGSGGAGSPGTPLTLNFTVTNSGVPTPTPTPIPAGQSVTSFTLINADTDLPIAGFDPIPASATINLASLPTQNLNVRANTNPAVVGSVRFGYDANANFGTETNVPYALASDNGGNYLAWTPSIGSHTVTATPYTAPNATGTIGTPLTLSFTVANSGVPTPTPTPIPAGQSVTSFTLINAESDQPIAGYNPIPEGVTISLSSLPTINLSVRANTNPATVGSLRFGYDAQTSYHTENIAPYSIAGDNGGNYDFWTPSTGSHTLVGTPYTGTNLSGTAGTPLTLHFSVTN